MQVILKEDIDHLGEVGDLVTVKRALPETTCFLAAWLCKRTIGKFVA